MTLGELREELEQARGALLAYVAAASDDEFYMNPNGHWSIAEHVDHLRRSEQLFSSLLGRVIERARGRGELREGPPHTFDPRPEVLHVFDDGMSAIPAFPGTEPYRGLARAELMDGIARTRVELARVFTEAAGSNMSGVTFRHPYLGVLALYDWFVFVAVHERAHLAQMRRHRGD